MSGLSASTATSLHTASFGPKWLQSASYFERSIVLWNPGRAANELLPVPEAELEEDGFSLTKLVRRVSGGLGIPERKMPPISMGSWLDVYQPEQSKRREFVRNIEGAHSDQAIVGDFSSDEETGLRMLQSMTSDLLRVNPNDTRLIDELNTVGAIIARGFPIPFKSIAPGLRELIIKSNNERIIIAVSRFIGNLISVSSESDRREIVFFLITSASLFAEMIHEDNDNELSPDQILYFQQAGMKCLYIVNEVLPVLSWKERKQAVGAIQVYEEMFAEFKQMQRVAMIRGGDHIQDHERLDAYAILSSEPLSRVGYSTRLRILEDFDQGCFDQLMVAGLFSEAGEIPKGKSSFGVHSLIDFTAIGMARLRYMALTLFDEEYRDIQRTILSALAMSVSIPDDFPGFRNFTEDERKLRGSVESRVKSIIDGLTNGYELPWPEARKQATEMLNAFFAHELPEDVRQIAESYLNERLQALQSHPLAYTRLATSSAQIFTQP